MGGPPLVILHCLSIWLFDFEKPRMCSSDKKRNILFIGVMNKMQLLIFMSVFLHSLCLFAVPGTMMRKISITCAYAHFFWI
jgi:hypothetical protein